MPKRTVAIAASVALTLLCFGAGPARAADETAAQAMLDAATQTWLQVSAMPPSDRNDESHARRVRLLRDVDALLQRIVDRHAGTRIAERLSSGAEIGGLSLARASLAVQQAQDEHCDH